MREKLHQLLLELRLKGMDNALDRELERAEKETPFKTLVRHGY